MLVHFYSVMFESRYICDNGIILIDNILFPVSYNLSVFKMMEYLYPSYLACNSDLLSVITVR